MVAHAREALPAECCGLLLGTAARIDAACRARNLDPSASRFLIDPQDHFAAIRAARASDRQVVGVYHSHPSAPATPSRADLAEASYTEYLYVIVSLQAATADVRLFRLDAGGFREETVIVVEV
jgi:proteasome lid subunit RPN8/RPN11